MKKYELVYLDTCSSCYFQGFNKPVIQVPVDGLTTIEQVKDYLVSYWATEHIEDLDNEAYQDAVLEYFTDLFIANQTKFPNSTVEDMMASFWNMNLEVAKEDDKEDWDVYSFFGLVEIEND